MSLSFKVRSYLNYWLDAVDQHSLHSPFLFDFYTAVVRQPARLHSIAEQLRRKLLADNRSIVVEDLGSKSKMNNVRRVANIASKTLSSPKFSSLYHRIIQRYNHTTIVELGTSLGINTLYLSAKKDAKVFTFEGAPEIASLAASTFEFGKATNIRIIPGDIATTFPEFLLSVRKLDFAFIDANHTYEATIKYFDHCLSKSHEKTVVVVDDIHSTPGMQKAWNKIRTHPLVHLSCDLYRCGVLFFDPSLNKQHVILQF